MTVKFFRVVKMKRLYGKKQQKKTFRRTREKCVKLFHREIEYCVQLNASSAEKNKKKRCVHRSMSKYENCRSSSNNFVKRHI